MFFVLGFFDVRRFCDETGETSLKLISKLTATIEVRVRGLDERVSRRPFGSYIFFVHSAPAHQQLPQSVPSA